MAQSIGTSGTWRRIVVQARTRGLKLNRAEDIATELQRLETGFPQEMESKRAVASEAIEDRRQQIDFLRSDKSFIGRFKNWFLIQKEEIHIRASLLDVERHEHCLKSNITFLQRLVNSPEVAGAKAELDMCQLLQSLPDDYLILNDVRIVADRYIRFNDNSLRSAQIDHLVIGPTGIFVIETKHWGTEFVETSDYHDPFDQVERASYLCFDMVRRRFREVRVRSIIVCFGAMLVAPPNKYVKVLRPSNVNQYIASYRDQKLDMEDTSRLRQLFLPFTST